MLNGSPQWRHMITLRSGGPLVSPRGGAILKIPELLCLMLSTKARRLSSMTAPSLISSQSSSRNGHWRLSAKFWPSSRSRRLSFSDNFVSGWNKMTSGNPWKYSNVVIPKKIRMSHSSSSHENLIWKQIVIYLHYYIYTLSLNIYLTIKKSICRHKNIKIDIYWLLKANFGFQFAYSNANG